jgi:hypothetical protein
MADPTNKMKWFYKQDKMVLNKGEIAPIGRYNDLAKQVK